MDLTQHHDEDGLTYGKASASTDTGQNCVLVAVKPDGGVAIRDSKNFLNGPRQDFTRGEWLAFLQGAKAGEFDLPG